MHESNPTFLFYRDSQCEATATELEAAYQGDTPRELALRSWSPAGAVVEPVIFRGIARRSPLGAHLLQPTLINRTRETAGSRAWRAKLGYYYQSPN